MVQDIINGVVGGLSDFFSNIGSTILDIFANFIGIAINVIMFPIDTLITSIFPSFSDMLSNFANSVSLLASAPIGFIMYHIPPITRSVIMVFITLMIGYYGIIWTYRALIIIPKTIKRLKFW